MPPAPKKSIKAQSSAQKAESKKSAENADQTETNEANGNALGNFLAL